MKKKFNTLTFNMAHEKIQKKYRKPTLLLKQEELLAEEIKKYPCLYNKADRSYKERDVIRNAWESIFTKSFSFLQDGSKSECPFLAQFILGFHQRNRKRYIIVSNSSSSILLFLLLKTLYDYTTFI